MTDGSLEGPVRDVPADRYLRAPVTRGEVWGIAAVVSVLACIGTSLAALIAFALIAWSLS